ncbi:MAG: asparagine synthase-related protein [Phycisphaerae bacterium]
MIHQAPLHEVVDLTDPGQNQILNQSIEEARSRISAGKPEAIGEIDGHFALVGRKDEHVYLARSLAIPLRYFIAKRAAGPALIAANRISTIADYLEREGMADQFHPSYTRMAPAHYLTDISLVGCPDPSPVYRRFFEPERNTLPGDLDLIGRQYVEATAREIGRWLTSLDQDAPVGVCFSGGIDSGAIFLLTYHQMLQQGMNPSRLKAFTLSIDGQGDDIAQAHDFLAKLNLSLFHEIIEADKSALDLSRAVELLEDYKPLDVQAGAMTAALLAEIRNRYGNWRYLLDGDGGDENLKDYPIEENPELTIRSVLNNPMLYHEGWGVHTIKHSLTYTGGLSRGCTRGFAPAAAFGFSLFSPFMLPSVVAVSEGIPFIELTDWDHEKLYALKGDIVSRGIRQVTGMAMPTFEKRRFQHGAASRNVLEEELPDSQHTYRQAFQTLYAHSTDEGHS